MSELINTNDNRATIRWKLLTGASALALSAYISSAGLARAEDADHSQVWIELGGQLNRLEDSQEIFKPHFVTLTPSIFSPPQEAERPPLYGMDANAGLTFQPAGSDWIFSASIRYGRASTGKHVRHQTYPSSSPLITVSGGSLGLIPALAARFTDAEIKQSEKHLILDFQAGKDVGLGMFGPGALSTLSLGVRFAQFTSRSQNTLKEDPDWKFNQYIATLHYGKYTFYTPVILQAYHTYIGTFRADRSFRGIGPSLSWKSSVPFAGNSHDGELMLDFNVNAALLFGRQRTKTHHQTTGIYHPSPSFAYQKYGTNKARREITYERPTTPDHTRSRNITVPNVGGSVGLSWKLQNFKMSLGYRADMFFGAIDGGIDARKNENRAFYGPYASISIGLGD